MSIENGFAVEHEKKTLHVWVDERGIVHVKTSSNVYILELFLKENNIQRLKHVVDEVITSDKVLRASVRIVSSGGCVIAGNGVIGRDGKLTKMVDEFGLGISSFNSCLFIVKTSVWLKFISDVEAIIGPIEPFVPPVVRPISQSNMLPIDVGLL